MKDKLTIEILSAYYPYSVKIQHATTKSHFWTLGHEEHPDYINIRAAFLCQNYGPSPKLVLHPLSDLTKIIEHNGERVIVEYIIKSRTNEDNWDKIEMYLWEEDCIQHLPLWVAEILLKYHFDIYSLIPAGLAVDINTVKI